MEIFSFISAMAGIAIAVYAHIKIPTFTDSAGKILFTRAALLAVGTAFGMVTSSYVTGTPQTLTSFFTSFGMVHVPAAVILFIKARRGETRS